MAYQIVSAMELVGKLIKFGNAALVFKDSSAYYRLEATSYYSSDGDQLDFCADVIKTIDGIDTRCDSSNAAIVSRIRQMLESWLREYYQCAYVSYDDSLVDLIAKATDAGESVKGNVVSIIPGYLELDDTHNQLGNYDQLMGITSDNVDERGLMYFVVEPVEEYSADYVVRIYNDFRCKHEHLIGQTVTFTGTGYKDVTERNGSGLDGRIRVTAAPVDATIRVEWFFEGIRAGTGKLTDWAATQMAIEDDILLLCTNASTPGSETWRVQSRVRGIPSGNSGLATTGVAFPGTAQDFLGVEFTIEAPTGRIWNDDQNLISGPAGITGGSRGVNCDSDGMLYVSVIDDGGFFYHIDFYSDPGLATLVAHTASYNTGGSKPIVADGSSGLGGSITVENLGADTGIEILLSIAFEEGDEFILGLDSDSDGVFQSYFRDFFFRTFPFVMDGTETIPDALAT